MNRVRERSRGLETERMCEHIYWGLQRVRRNEEKKETSKLKKYDDELDDVAAEYSKTVGAAASVLSAHLRSCCCSFCTLLPLSLSISVFPKNVRVLPMHRYSLAWMFIDCRSNLFVRSLMADLSAGLRCCVKICWTNRNDGICRANVRSWEGESSALQREDCVRAMHPGDFALFLRCRQSVGDPRDEHPRSTLYACWVPGLLNHPLGFLRQRDYHALRSPSWTIPTINFSLTYTIQSPPLTSFSGDFLMLLPITMFRPHN